MAPIRGNNLTTEQTADANLWLHKKEKMITDGILEFCECGPGRVLQGLVKKINREVNTSSI